MNVGGVMMFYGDRQGGKGVGLGGGEGGDRGREEVGVGRGGGRAAVCTEKEGVGGEVSCLLSQGRGGRWGKGVREVRVKEEIVQSSPPKVPTNKNAHTMQMACKIKIKIKCKLKMNEKCTKMKQENVPNKCHMSMPGSERTVQSI